MSVDPQDRADARRRVVIEDLQPNIDGGKWPIKRCIGEEISVEANLFADGHDLIRGQIHHRVPGEEWEVVELHSLGNDRYRGSFRVSELGRYEFGVRAWVDAAATWLAGLRKKLDAGIDVELEVRIGQELMAAAANRAPAPAAKRLKAAGAHLAKKGLDGADLDAWVELAGLYPATSGVAESEHQPVTVHPRLAKFSAWYEFFPRSFGPSGAHGTLGQAAEHLDYVADLGFDIVYLPPIHPIGRAHRKGPNNTLVAGPEDPGSPWAIGDAAGGHKSVHPELGTIDDFKAFVARARKLDLEVALDIAFQASPDHPWVSSHPEWFTKRPDGSIQYAENPPKKYQDIYPLNFESEDWMSLWHELRSVFEFWIDHGVRVFRVDNPHTKSLRFWAWCLQDLYDAHPDVILLSEAFTGPATMYRLAKMGFTQSYTYFTWRNSAAELREYMLELTGSPVREFFGPSFWPNTPDILPEHLQHGGRAAAVGRLILAATLTSSYGIYGPAYELMEHVARPGSGEYIDNEKYQLKDWPLERHDSLRHLIKRINRIRSNHPALHSNDRLTFHHSDNPNLLAYSKRSEDGGDVILVIVNVDWHNTQAGDIALDLDALGLDSYHPFEVHDLISDARYEWSGHRNYVSLSPAPLPCHLFHVVPK
ncbi:MAG: DUF3416 domain-containing protein [Deltaproteobacteria bacterium]|jgi:starch synthase (maltosyl-transferring)|nr:DUF3416 domain-containing protein [Deltaproteobacteria bacterium]